MVKIETMISIEAWRAVIGAFVSGKNPLQNLLGGRRPVASYAGSSFSLIFTLISANLVIILLIIGGIESNPGPNSEGNSTECAIYRKNFQLLILKIQSIVYIFT